MVRALDGGQLRTRWHERIVRAGVTIGKVGHDCRTFRDHELAILEH